MVVQQATRLDRVTREEKKEAKQLRVLSVASPRPGIRGIGETQIQHHAPARRGRPTTFESKQGPSGNAARWRAVCVGGENLRWRGRWLAYAFFAASLAALAALFSLERTLAYRSPHALHSDLGPSGPCTRHQPNPSHQLMIPHSKPQTGQKRGSPCATPANPPSHSPCTQTRPPQPLASSSSSPPPSRPWPRCC